MKYGFANMRWKHLLNAMDETKWKELSDFALLAPLDVVVCSMRTIKPEWVQHAIENGKQNYKKKEKQS